MPDALSSARVESEDAVGEEIVTVPRHAVKIKRRRTRCGEHHAGLYIDSYASPSVSAAGKLVCVRGPGVVTEFAGFRNRMKDPAHFPRIHIEGADMAGRAGQRFGNTASKNDGVFENSARRA